MRNYYSNPPLISIIIICFNYGKYLNKAIISSLNQTYYNIEVIVIDDGSTDNTSAIATRYIQKIRYYYINNSGVSEARNYGIRKAKGKYLILLDADDFLDKNFVNKTIKILEQNTRIAFVYTQLKFFGTFSKMSHFSEYNFHTLTKENYIPSCTLIKRRIFNKYYFDKKFEVLEDWDLYLSLAEKGYFGKLLNEPLLNYRRHGKSRNTLLTNNKIRRRTYTKIYLKHYRLYSKLRITGHLLFDILMTLINK